MANQLSQSPNTKNNKEITKMVCTFEERFMNAVGGLKNIVYVLGDQENLEYKLSTVENTLNVPNSNVSLLKKKQKNFVNAQLWKIRMSVLRITYLC